MNADRLIAEFGRLVNTPEAVTRLRRFVLDLAVRGRLVDQDHRDSPGPLTVAKTPDDSEESSGDEEDVSKLPFAIPETWGSHPLGNLIRMVNGRAFKPTDWLAKGLPIVRIQNLNNESAQFNYCDPDAVDDRHRIDTGAFLISWSGTPGTSFGAFIWKRGQAALNQHIFRCELASTDLFDEYLRIAINGRLDEMIAKAHGGVGLQHITKGKLESLRIPVPPLAEQRRIVERVEEVMALCDNLEDHLGATAALTERSLNALLEQVLSQD